jgi:putative Ca2+/H+ antiporter (TMEM165/GDT1 family)
MLEIILVTYAAVFVAEIVGDKLLYTSGVLATRFSWPAVVTGMSLAFMGKMAVAVAVGATIGNLLPKWLVATMTAVSFIGVAVAMWRQSDVRVPKEKDTRILRGALIAFTTIFFSEWGDKGMLTAGTWAAAHVAAAPSKGIATTRAAWLVWFAAVMAMVTKGALAVTLGASVRKWIAEKVSPRRVRHFAVAALIILGILGVLDVLVIRVH